MSHFQLLMCFVVVKMSSRESQIFAFYSHCSHFTQCSNFYGIGIKIQVNGFLCYQFISRDVFIMFCIMICLLVDPQSNTLVLAKRVIPPQITDGLLCQLFMS